MTEKIDKDILIKHWFESSEKDFKTMMDLYQTKNFNWSLFVGHLVLEKLLKALFVKFKEEYPPLIHDLRRIGEKAGIEVDKEKQILLDTISRFNINARYGDYKNSFFELCTKDFTNEWISKIKDCRLWLKTML